MYDVSYFGRYKLNINVRVVNLNALAGCDVSFTETIHRHFC